MIKTIIIDDEADGRDSLVHAIQTYCQDLEIIRVCHSAPEGLEAIQQDDPDLVFLDIQMPHMSGFELLQQAGNIDCKVIFVTAHNQYAIKAIKFSALDYLLKPVDVDDLLQAVKRYRQQAETTNKDQFHHLFSNLSLTSSQFEKLAVPSVDGIEFIPVQEIIFCQADGNYTKIHLRNRNSLLASRTLKDFEMLLSEAGFYRVHHASLINLKHISKYVKGEGGYLILAEGHEVPVSRRRKEALLKRLSL